MGQRFTLKKLFELILGHIITTFYILSKFANTTKDVFYLIDIFKSFGKAESPLQQI